MEIDKVFSSDVDGVADNLFSAVKNSVSEIKAMQQRKAAENVQLVIQALKKIESDLQDKFDGVTTVIEKRVATIKDGRDGLDGRNGRDGKDGRPGRDGAPGARGPAGVPGTNGRDGEDGVSVTDARIDFDGSLIISLSSGREINVGEVVAPDLAEKIKVITNGGGTSQSVLDSLASLQAQITALQNLGAVNYVGTWNASTNSPTITSGSGDKGDYYVVSVAGSTNIDGQTLWGVGDWIIFNGAVWQKVDGGSTGDFTNLSASGTVTFTGLNASQAVFTNGSDELVSNAITGTGNVVMSASPTLTGTASLAALTTSSTVTHNGGTANGVAYLNGSKVLTTGSALTFDGSIVTNTGVGFSADNANALYRFRSAAGVRTAYLQARADAFDIWSDQAAVPMVFGVANSEQMRLTSTGLGIGTSSPSYKLDISGSNPRMRIQPSTGTEYALYQAQNTGGSAFIGLENSAGSALSTGAAYSLNIYHGGAYPILFSTNAVERMRLDASGNLGLGVTPSAWSGIGKTLQINTGGAISADTANTYFSSNSYYNGSNWIYQTTNNATRYTMATNFHAWYTAPSGTAGDPITFTQAMTLDASGNLLVGDTATIGSARFYVLGSVANFVARIRNSNAGPSGLDVTYTTASPNNTGNQFLYCADSTAERASIRSNGGLANYSANDVNLSDRREKTNFAPAKSYLETICAIPVQTFNYIDQSEDDPGLTLGVVAQDVQAVAPELVMESNWGTEDNPKMRLSVYQTDLQYALMKALQELKSELDSVKAELATLKGA